MYRLIFTLLIFFTITNNIIAQDCSKLIDAIRKSNFALVSKELDKLNFSKADKLLCLSLAKQMASRRYEIYKRYPSEEIPWKELAATLGFMGGLLSGSSLIMLYFLGSDPQSTLYSSVINPEAQYRAYMRDLSLLTVSLFGISLAFVKWNKNTLLARVNIQFALYQDAVLIEQAIRNVPPALTVEDEQLGFNVNMTVNSHSY